MKVYLVTEGEYSDFRVVAAFSTREKAKEYAIKRSKYDSETNRFDEDILEFEIDGLLNREQFVEVKYFPEVQRVYFGNISYESGKDAIFQNFNGRGYCRFYVSVNHRVFNYRSSEEVKEHLLKIAQDKYAEYKAKQAGVD